MKYKINASILSANFSFLKQEINDVLEAGADNIHFDVMDNHFVPNLTFGPIVLKSLRESQVNAKIDVHLMVNKIGTLIKDFAISGASSIVFHPQPFNDVTDKINLIKSYGVEAGLVVNPDVALNIIYPYIDKIDRILIMGVNPGFGGQKFIDSVYEKIISLSQFLEEENKDVLIEVDGGINVSNISKVAACGAKAFVLGSAIFETKDYKESIKKIQTKLLLKDLIRH